MDAKATDTRTQSKVHGAALTFLQRYHDDGDEFLDRIITGDGTWVAHITPEPSSCQCIGDTVDLPARRNEESDVHGVLGQTGHSPRRLPETVNA